MRLDITLIPKPEKDGIKKEKYEAILFKPRLKNPKINISKLDLVLYKKDIYNLS